MARLVPALVLLAVTGTVLASVSETWWEYKARTQAIRKRAKRSAEGEGDTVHSRQKRTLAFPTGSVFAITPIFCIPVVTETNITGKLYIELPFRVTLPNTTDVNNVFGRTDDRVGIYNVIMDALRRFGVDGKSCLLRTICEVAEAPLYHDGLLGVVMNTLLSVNTDVPAPEELQEFTNAEYFGKAYGNCDEAFSKCPLSLFKLIE